MCSLLLRASETVSLSDDTIPSRYRNYYYTHWYDECTAYQDGGWVDSCWYFQFRALYAANKPIKREYTNGPLKVKGIVAMIALEPHVGYSMYPYPETQFLYLMKRADTVDTVHPNSPIQHIRMRILDSARFDTVVPRYMEMTQGSDNIPLNYCYVYEAYFDKPVVVDSEFYLYGTGHTTWFTDEGHQRHHMYKPLDYVEVNMQLNRSVSQACQDADYPSSYPNSCPTEGHWNTLHYLGYTDLSELGYPVTDLPWAETAYTFENDPYGFYLAIVENYKLDVYSDSLPMGSAEGSGIYYNSDGTEIRAVPHAGYVFSHWNDGSTDNPRVVCLTQDTVFTAYFDTGAYYNVQTAVTPAGWGAVEGGGMYAVNTEVELTAEPTEGFMFERWDDGDIQNPRTVTVTQDTLFTAVFALDTTPTGIPEAGRLAFGIAPNPTGGRLTVTLGEDSPCEAEVYDATGRCVLRATLQGPQSDLDVRRLPAGRYTLRLTCGDKSGIKVFVRK